MLVVIVVVIFDLYIYTSIQHYFGQTAAFLLVLRLINICFELELRNFANKYFGLS